MFSKLATRTFTINTNSSPNSRQGSIYAHPKTEFADLDRLYENERHSELLLSDDVPSSPSSTALPEHECVLTPTYATRSAEGEYQPGRSFLLGHRPYIYIIPFHFQYGFLD
jgi:hypothetical protein